MYISTKQAEMDFSYTRQGDPGFKEDLGGLSQEDHQAPLKQFLSCFDVSSSIIFTLQNEPLFPPSTPNRKA